METSGRSATLVRCSDSAEGRPGPQPRSIGGTAVLLVVLVGVGGWLTLRWFVHPAVVTSQPGPADAVVMFGGAGARFPEAVRLAEDGHRAVAGRLRPEGLRLRSGPPTAPSARRSTPTAPSASIPEPRTTRGEARFVADLARREGWERIVVVATTEQAMRASRLLERCWDGEVQVADVSSGRSRPLRIAYEWAASLRAAVTRRGC